MILKFLIPAVLFILIIHGCREKYEMVYTADQASSLVVECIINTQGSTKVNLSRTTLLSEKGTNYENEATINIEGEDNSVYPVLFTDSGTYMSRDLMLNEDIRYRLSIKTHDNRVYLSTFVQPVKTPEIDSITWTRYRGGVEIFANAHDDVNNTQYYKFDYDETWEFKSRFKSFLVTVLKRTPPGDQDVTYAYSDTVSYRPNESIYTCWQSKVSTSILTVNTVKLGKNRLYASIVQYPKDAWEFSYLYSMNLRMQGISKEGYNFFQTMKKNTESLGSIFDAQPSEVAGNVRCITDTSEKVIGFVDASRIKSKRIFISNSELPDWNYYEPCKDSLIPINKRLFYEQLYINGWRPLDEIFQDGSLVGITTADKFCVDCTIRGTNIKPSFWPN